MKALCRRTVHYLQHRNLPSQTGSTLAAESVISLLQPIKVKRYRYIFLAILLIIVAVGVYAYREYHRKPAVLTEVAADAELSADSLLAAYSTNEDAANKKYLGKILDVTGEIASLGNEQDTVINILLGPKEGMSHVSCSVSATELSNLKSLAVGKSATIRGVCTGYLMDVELNRCVIVK
jgi:hypothetical protein